MSEISSGTGRRVSGEGGRISRVVDDQPEGVEKAVPERDPCQSRTGEVRGFRLQPWQQAAWRFNAAFDRVCDEPEVRARMKGYTDAMGELPKAVPGA